MRTEVTTQPHAVEVSGLRKSYGRMHAVRDVGFTVGYGEIVALLGPNGAGKTTTLEILEGFRTRDGGTAEVLGHDPGARSSARELRERTGLVLQDIAVEPYLTVRETIARAAGYYQAPRDVAEVIGLVGLGGLELWLAYLLLGQPRLAWATVADLGVAAVLGLTMAVRWIRVYRAYAKPGPALTRETIAPPERSFPVPVVIAHGLLAVTTLVLVLLTALGVGRR